MNEELKKTSQSVEENEKSNGTIKFEEISKEISCGKLTVNQARGIFGLHEIKNANNEMKVELK